MFHPVAHNSDRRIQRYLLAIPAIIFASSIVSWAAPHESYSAVWKHNIFLRDRAEKKTDDPTPTPQQPLEHLFVVRGIVFDTERFRARVEDLRDGSVLTFYAGDYLVYGRIADIRLDAVVYEKGDRSQTRVVPGCDLTGGRVVGAVSGRQ